MSILLRVIVSLIFIPIFWIVFSHGGYPFLAFVLLIVGLCQYEFYKIVEAKGMRPLKSLGIIIGILWTCGFFLQEIKFNFKKEFLTIFLVFSFLLILVVHLFRKRGFSPVADISTTLFGFVYTVLPLSFILLLRLEFAKNYASVLGRWEEGPAFLPFFVTWSCDTVAYFIGISFGKHKILPNISPNKSVEGSLGGFIASIGACLFAKILFSPYLSFLDCFLLGSLIGIFGLLGDFVESLIKRDANVKDTSRILPGHGGILDRFDSLIFTIPLCYYYLSLFVFR